MNIPLGCVQPLIAFSYKILENKILNIELWFLSKSRELSSAHQTQQNNRRKGKTIMKMFSQCADDNPDFFYFIIIDTTKMVQFKFFFPSSFDDSVLGAFSTTAIWKSRQGRIQNFIFRDWGGGQANFSTKIEDIFHVLPQIWNP